MKSAQTGPWRPGEPGYYPGYHTLEQADAWDEATRKTVLARVERRTELEFFTPEEGARLKAVLERLAPQDDRDAEHRIPLLAAIDERLASGRGNGYRYEDMPPDGEAYRLGLEGIDAIAMYLHGHLFLTLRAVEQDEVLLTIHDARPPTGMEIWRRMPPDRFWRLILNDALEAYYAHPFAWDEIGFGGPAYPRGYMRLLHGDPEPWEKPERRYAFEAPADSLSGRCTPLGTWPHGGGR